MQRPIEFTRIADESRNRHQHVSQLGSIPWIKLPSFAYRAYLQEGNVAEYAVYAPVGRLDASNSRQCEAELMAVLEEGNGSMLLDLSGVEFLSSAGLRLLLVAANFADKRGGVIRVSGARPAVREVLIVSTFDEILTLLD